MPRKTTGFTYHLPVTRVRVPGTSTVTKKIETDKPETTATCRIELFTDADAENHFQFKLEESHFSDTSLSLVFSDEGLLVSTEVKSVGKMGQILKNVIGFVTTIAKFSFFGMGPASISRFEAADGKGDPVGEKYKTAHPLFAARREKLEGAVHVLANKLVELENGIATAADAATRTDLDTHAKLLVDGLTRLRDEAKPLEEHFTAWKAKEENPVTTAHELVVNLGDLPTRDTVESWQVVPDKVPGAFGPIFDWFRIVIALKDLPQPPGPDSPADMKKWAGEGAGVLYRCARPIELSIYTVSKNDKDQEELTLSKRTIEYIVDGDSRLGFVEFGTTTWTEKTAELAFSERGTLKSVKNTKASTVAAATGALKELPAEVSAALTKANEIIDQAQVMALQGIEQRIAELEDQKKLIEARIARDGALATQAQTEEAKRLEAEIQYLKTKKGLGISTAGLSHFS